MYGVCLLQIYRHRLRLYDLFKCSKLTRSLSRSSISTNSNHYPNEWNSPEVYEYLFHRTADECCESLLNGGYDECFVVNACREVTVVTTEIAALEDVSKDCLDEWHMSVEPDEEGIW